VTQSFIPAAPLPGAHTQRPQPWLQQLSSLHGFAVVGVRELDAVSVTRLFQTMLTRLPERCLIQTNHRRETQETPRGRSRLVSGTSPCHSSWPAVMIVLRVRAFLSRCDRVHDREPRGCAGPRRVPQSPDSNASLPPSSGSRALCRVLHRADATGRPGPKADRSSFFGRPGEKRSFKAFARPAVASPTLPGQPSGADRVPELSPGGPDNAPIHLLAIDFHRDGCGDETHRNDEVKGALLAEQDALHVAKRPIHDSDTVSDRYEWMRNDRTPRDEQSLNRLEFVAKTDLVGDRENAQGAIGAQREEAVGGSAVEKDVAREQGHVRSKNPARPPYLPLMLRQVVGNGRVEQVTRDRLLLPTLRLDDVPERRSFGIPEKMRRKYVQFSFENGQALRTPPRFSG
jgi:hypothetical protein